MTDSTPTFDTPLDGAMYMLTRGFNVLPLKENTKVPATTNWQRWSETATIGTLETTYNPYNWGVHPGVSGHFVVDIDNKKGKNGNATWLDLLAKHGSVPETFTVETPTGGRHLYFRGKVAGTNTVIGKDVDTRATDGYVVAPGSTVEDGKYVIVDDREPAEAPEWLLSLVVPKLALATERPAVSEVDNSTEITRAITYLKSAPKAIEGHNGDSDTYKTACAVRDFGISQEKALDLMLDYWNPDCTPPWSNDDLAVKVNSAYNYAQNSLGAKTEEARLKAAVELFQQTPITVLQGAEVDADFDSLLKARRFNLKNPPVRTEPVLWVGDVGVAKPGDLVVVQAKIKSGKSSVLGAMMASLLGAPNAGHDYLGFRGANPKNFPVLHIDTEQSPEDHFDLVKRTLDRAGIDNHPDWFYSYCITDFTIDKLRLSLDREAARLFDLHGGLCAIFLDGIGDLCKDVNDPVAATALVNYAYTLTIKYRCPFINVLHENHGSDTGKTRGHLGSHLARKAAANLRLEKDPKSGIVSLWSENLRRGHIAKGDGPSFIWSKEADMHVSCTGVKAVVDYEAAAAFETAKEECDRFLDEHVKKPLSYAKDLRELATELKTSFAAVRTDRFVANLANLLNGNSKFRLAKEPFGQEKYYVERIVALTDLL